MKKLVITLIILFSVSANSPDTLSVEKVYPVFMIFKVDKDISVPCLVDENRNVLHSGRFFKTDMPIIIMEKNFLEDASNSEFINILFSNLVHITKTSRNFAEELAEIKINRDMDLIVTLKNRRTNFIIKNSLSGFKKIEKSAAYFDAVNTYPEVINLNDRRALIR